ncbi:hypothetical protein RhiirC2_871211 [Rhizophagus irregularis]|uniref:BED-type domain-containing protein n=1 Tax=Rhizophagus irregularis TaxID=588596 RepID=A0A2N1MDB6_9GLOM|nr:hypothetical protein RhiirC2_871211 [Rhizophagus irregularis]
MTDEIIIEDEDITHNPLAEKKKKKKWKRVLLLVSEVLKVEEEETRICTILDKDSNRCGKMYRNTRSSTGNLIAHLRDVHQIIDEDESENNSKRLKNTKITDFAQSH